MRVRDTLCGVIGVVMAAWVGGGRWLFGAGGELSWWYVPGLALPLAVLAWWTARRLHRARTRGRRVGRAPYVALALSWFAAFGFGATVPDLVDGELVSVLTALAGPEWIEMSIGVCNPFGILAVACAIAALLFASAAGREKRPEEIEDAHAPGMVPHPLQR